MANYIGKIYRIVNSDNLCYYGSTIQDLNVRFLKHRSNYNIWLSNKKKDYYSSYEVLSGKNVKIELVLECMCNSREELLKYEQNFIDNNQCVNKNNAQTSKDFWAQYSKDYYQQNRERLTINRQMYRLLNKESYNIKNREYQRRFRNKRKAEQIS